jgi:hypothetical protein
VGNTLIKNEAVASTGSFNDVSPALVERNGMDDPIPKERAADGGSTFPLFRSGIGAAPSSGLDRWRQIAGRDWTILQDTHLAWSKGGFPFGAIGAAVRLSSRRLAVVIHDPLLFGGPRPVS